MNVGIDERKKRKKKRRKEKKRKKKLQPRKEGGNWTNPSSSQHLIAEAARKGADLITGCRVLTTVLPVDACTLVGRADTRK